MPCYHPLQAFKYFDKKHSVSGNPLVRVYGSRLPPVDADRVFHAGRGEYFMVPCGQCIGCRLERSRQWANRCMLELEYHDSAYFVTLTYDDDHVPVAYYTDDDTGEAFPAQTLCRRDVQLFLKRLRKRFGSGIRYFGCGEYGPETLRPHYHLILFGLKLDDLVPFGKSEQGFQYYLSSSMVELWSHRKAPARWGAVNCLSADADQFFDPIGHVMVAEVSWETCAYVARYCTDKLTGAQADYYDRFNLVPPFSMMSTHPGIAKQWYIDHPDVYDYQYICVSTPTGGLKFKPPRYFDKLYDVDEPEQLSVLKESRKRMALEAQKAKVHLSYYDPDEILKIEEAAQSEKARTLRRYL